ncbi:Arc family DNA-binding protein [Glycomyces terrestris]|uniref:Arc family DNA-binding protein n=1 Tax=Glycomyces terrestris TaxID=2493553 RepID=A0A426UTX8_9ACTN|nr:Arc family DNA-binding protein [Glycomyces terrestris]RRR97289.1 Arc family DNA-binding protein [Glycomyces terrestris]
MEHETRLTLRLPSDVRTRLSAKAKSARRSLNAEIVYRLESSLRIEAELPAKASDLRDSL